jgi:MYXO-CTERM domain-containing protein
MCTAPSICGNGIKEGSEVCDGSDFGGATCVTLKGAGWTGTPVCTGSCSTIDSSTCVAPAPVCGDGSINGSEECDSSASPSIKPGDSCASKLGVGYTGSLSCDGSCKLVTSACVAPPSCGNGVKDPSEQCEGSDLGGKGCADIKGTGWSGTLKCTGSCTYDTTSCSFDWGIKNLSGACSMSGDPANPTVSFTGGACSADYWPISAVSPAKIKWASVAGKAIAIAVATSGSPTVVSVPQGVDHSEILDNGNHYEQAAGGGFSAAVEGTTYSDIWLSSTVMRFTCTDGKISLKMNGLPFPGITISGEAAGVIPAGWTVDADVFSGTVTKAPSKLDPGDAGVDAGDAGDSGSDAGDSGVPDGGADSGSDSGPPDADSGVDSGTPTPVAPSDPGGCTCATAGHSGSGVIAMLALLALAAVMIRRRS